MFAHLAFIGSRTTRERNARGRGISCFGVDGSGKWTALAVTETADNPSFLAADRAGRTLYAVHGDRTEMTSYRIGADGALELLDRETSAGLNPVDVALDPTEEFLVVTNHLSDALTARRRHADGRFGDLAGFVVAGGTLGPHRVEQTRVKPHQARFFPDGRLLAVPNKGADTLAVFRLDHATGALYELADRTTRFREGSGPRNLVFHPTLPIIYVVCELDSTVCALSFDGDGRTHPLEVRSCRPDDGFAPSRAAAIVVSGDGRHLHATSRGADCIATFPLSETGRLGLPSFRSTLGLTPRFACMDPDGSSLIVANEDSDTIVRFRGGDDAGEVVAETASPVAVVFVTGPGEN